MRSALVLVTLVAIVAVTLAQTPTATRTTFTDTAQEVRSLASSFYSSWGWVDYSSDISIAYPFCRAGLTCAEPPLVECCAACDGFMPLGGQTNCVCPTPGFSCLTAGSSLSTTFKPSQLAFGSGPLLFELAVRNDCRAWSVDLVNHVGEADMTLRWYYGAHQANRDGNDHITVCPAPPASVWSGGHPSVLTPNSILRQLLDVGHAEPWVRVQLIVLARLSADFTLSVSMTSDAQPIFVHPLTTHYNMLPLKLSCGAQVCSDPWPNPLPLGNACWLVNLPPTARISDSLALESNFTQAFGGPATYLNNRFMYLNRVRAVSNQSPYSFLLSLNYSTCKPVLPPGLLVAANSGAATAPANVTTLPNVLQPFDICRPASYLPLLNTGISTRGAQYFTDLLADNLGSVVSIWTQIGADTVSNGYYNCINMLGSIVAFDQLAPKTVVDTACSEPFQSPAWYTDPCCNIALQTLQCCLPRERQAITYLFKPAPAMDQCAEPECAKSALEDSERFRGKDILNRDVVGSSTTPCLNAFLTQTALLGAAVNPLASCTRQLKLYDALVMPCDSDQDCPWTSCSLPAGVCAPAASAEALATCVWESLTPPYVRATVTDCSTLDEFLAKYLVAPAPGTNLTAPYCNYDFTVRSSAECLSGVSHMNTSFCALAQPTGLTEISVFGGCSAWTSTNSPLNKFSCEIQPDAATGAARVWARGSCWIDSIPDRQSCLPPGYCAFPGGDDCPSFCYLPVVAQSDCSLYQSQAPMLQWLSELTHPLTAQPGLCVYVGSQDWGPGICNTSGGWWFSGRRWTNSRFNTPELCSAGGCDADHCNGPSCSRAQCTVAGNCLPARYGSSADVCIVPADTVFDRYLVASGYKCEPGGVLRDDNTCVLPALRTRADCLAHAGTAQWQPAQVNETACVAQLQCLSSLGQTTPKSPSNCTRCGGTSVPSSDWQPSIYYPANRLFWLPRAFAPSPVSATSRSFDIGRYSVDYFYGQMAVLGRANDNLIQCFAGRGHRLLTAKLACACGSRLVEDYLPMAEECARISFSAPELAVLYLCSLVESIWEVTGYASLRSQNTSQWVGSACAELRVNAIDGLLLRRRQSRALSSPYVNSFRNGPLDVIKNRNDIVVGRIIGNAFLLTVLDDLVIAPGTAGLELCVALSEGGAYPSRSSRYPIYDFAYADDVVLGADYSNIKLKLMHAKTYTRMGENDGEEVLFLCTEEIRSGGFYAPAARSSGETSSAHLYDVLTKQQLGSLITLIVLYVLLFIAAWACVIEHTYKWVIATSHRTELDAKPLKSPALRMAVFLLVVLFSFIRWIYFLLLLLGVMSSAPLVISALMTELPTYFYLSMFTLLLLVWSKATVAFSFKGDLTSSLRIQRGLTAAAVIVNFILYTCLLVFIIIYAVEGSTDSASPTKSCFASSSVSFDSSSTDSADKSVIDVTGIVFHIIVALLVLLLAVCFALVLLLLYKELGVVGMMARRDWRRLFDRLFTFSSVVLLVCVALIGQAAVLVAVSFVNIDTITALFLLLIFEWGPAILLQLAMLELVRKKAIELVTKRTTSGSKSSTPNNYTTEADF